MATEQLPGPGGAVGRVLAGRMPMIVLSLVGVAGLLIRFFQLGTESYWVDEVIMLRVAGGDAGLVFSEFLSGGRPPLYVLLQNLWIDLFGTSEAATRALPALISAACVPLIFMVGRRLVHVSVGLMAATLIALAPVQIYHAQNIRYYSLFILCALLAYLSYVRALEERHTRDYAGYLLASVALLYTHSFGVFAIAGQSLYLVLRWRRHRDVWLPMVATQALIGLLFLPMLLVSFGIAAPNTAEVSEWLPMPVLADLPLVLLRLVTPVAPGLPALLVSAGLLLVGVLWARRRTRAAPPGQPAGPSAGQVDGIWLCLCWLLCPLLLPFLASYIIGPIFHPRYVVSASPAAYLLVAWGLYALRRRLVPALGLAAIVTLMFPGLVLYFVQTDKQQWRELATFLQQQGRTGDLVVLAAETDGDVGGALHWYYRGDLPDCALDRRSTSDTAIAAALQGCAPDAQRLWVIITGSPRFYEPFEAYFVIRQPPGWQLVQQHLFVGIDLYELARR